MTFSSELSIDDVTRRAPVFRELQRQRYCLFILKSCKQGILSKEECTFEEIIKKGLAPKSLTFTKLARI